MVTDLGCICCANGNDLPDGEYCRACYREGTATGLRAAVIRARGRSEPPNSPIQFDGPPGNYVPRTKPMSGAPPAPRKK